MRILKFGSQCCGPCKVMEEKFKKNPPSIEYQSLDVEDDSNEEVISQYNIKNLPTMILVDNSGTELERWNGIVNPELIEKSIKKYSADDIH
jgi:thioredoxin 1